MIVAWVVIGAAVLAIVVFGAMKAERMRIAAETARETERIDGMVREARDEVAGMDDDELDAAVYGPRRDDTPVGVRGPHSDERGS